MLHFRRENGRDLKFREFIKNMEADEDFKQRSKINLGENMQMARNRH